MRSTTSKMVVMPARPEKSERQQRNARMAPKPMPTNWRVNDASAMVSDAAQITSEPYASRQSHATSTGTLTF